MPITEIYPGIFRITLPLPGKKPGPVNVYVFKGENISLIDTGTPLSINHLKRGLLKIGIGFSDIDQIILTHGHIDHYSGVNLIQRKRTVKASVYAHKDEISEIETGTYIPLISYHRFLTRVGAPYWISSGIFTMFSWYKFLSMTSKVTHRLNNNDIIKLGNYHGKIIETPGHTKGSVCIFLEKENILFSGDHIISHITPVALPMLEENSWSPERSSQAEFFHSLTIIEKINPETIFPAHGEIIDDFNKTHKMYKKAFLKRQNEIFAIIQNNEEKTIYEIARVLFTSLNNKRFLLEIFLAVSEVFTHIQVLEAEGRVKTRVKKSVLFTKIIK